MKRFCIAILISFLILKSVSTNAKCALAVWKFSGTIKSSINKEPINEAQVFIFLDENESTYSDGHSTKYPDFFLTDRNGTFEGISYFDTFKRWNYLEGDVCTKKPSVIEIIITKTGFISKRIKINISELIVNKDPMGYSVILPEIYLDISK